MSTGYAFVPFSEQVRRVPRSHAQHNRYIEGTFSGALEVTFVAEQAVHVGSGFKAVHDNDVVRRGMLVHGAPGIPGASMKGVLRSRYEAITKSCAGQAPKDGTVRSSSYPDIRRGTFTQEVRRQDVFVHCTQDRMCAACALFGRMSQRSRITVVDFTTDCDFAIESMPEQFSPNAHHLGKWRITEQGQSKRFEVIQLEGRKFGVGHGPVAPRAQWQKVEVIPKGTHIRGSLVVRNVLSEELGGLLVAIGKQPPSVLKIGAGKGNARRNAMQNDPSFGRIQLHESTWHLNNHLRERIDVDDTRLAAWRQAFEQSADRWQKGEDALVQIHQGAC